MNASRPVSRVLYGRSSSPRRDGHSSGTPVAGRLEQPTRATGATDKPCGVSRASLLFGFAPGGACRAADVAAGAVRSYRTLSPLPRRTFQPARGGLLSVALSLGSPPPDVIRRRVRMEPGLSSASCGGRPADWRARHRRGAWRRSRRKAARAFAVFAREPQRPTVGRGAPAFEGPEGPTDGNEAKSKRRRGTKATFRPFHAVMRAALVHCSFIRFMGMCGPTGLGPAWRRARRNPGAPNSFRDYRTGDGYP